MTVRLAAERAFKRALIASAVLHTILFIMIFTVPSLPKPAKKAMTYYVNFGGMPGPPGGSGGSGGSGGARAPQPAPPPEPTTTLESTPVAKKESLRDLTIPQKATPPAPAETKRYPVEKPKREPTPPPEKKAVISKPAPGAKTEGTAAQGDPAAAGQSGSAGSGLRIGGLGDGAPGSGGGTGGGFGGGGGGNFPFAYYLGFIMDKVSANWFTFTAAPQTSSLLTVQVFFRIQRNGQITDLRVEQSSGDPTLDMRAMRAVQESVPFPPLPNEYEDRYLGVHLVFEHQK